MLSNKTLIYLLILIIAIPFLSACKDKYVLSKEKMVDVLFDLQVAQAVSQNRSKDFMSAKDKEKLQNYVLEKHGINKAILDSSLVWYADRIEVLIRINDSVNSRLKTKQELYSALLDEEARKENFKYSDFPPYFYLTNETALFRFNLDSLKLQSESVSDSSYLSFNILGVSPSVRIKSHIYLEYADTSVVTSEYLTKSADTLYIPCLPDRKLLNFSGYFRVDSVSAKHPDYSILFYDFKLGNDSISSVSSDDNLNTHLQSLKQR